MSAELGTCALCGQQMVRADGDVWHPFDVPKACPPEPTEMSGWSEFFAAGNRPGRPGVQHFRSVCCPLAATTREADHSPDCRTWDDQCDADWENRVDLGAGREGEG